MATKKYISGRGATHTSPSLTTHGRILREGRLELGISQMALGDAIGRDHAEISRIERSPDYLPRASLLVAHLEALGMHLAIVRPNGDVVLLPASDFLDASGRPKVAIQTKRRRTRK